MAHFAKLGLNGKVLTVISVNNSVLLDSNGIEQEQKGIDFLTEHTNWPIWVQCSYNTIKGVHQLGGTPFRKNYPGAGYIYDEEKNAFRMAKPYNSWILNEETCMWEAPVARPEVTAEQNNNSIYYSWNESTQEWTLVDNSEVDNSEE